MRALADIGFDEADYLLRYADVRAAVRDGQFASGKQHYQRHGRDEARLGRSLSPARLAAASIMRRWGILVAVAKPARDHWSGLTLSCERRSVAPGHLRVTIFSFSARGERRVVEKTMSLDEIDDRHPCTLYWPPLAGTAGKRFLVVIRQVDGNGRQLRPPPLRVASVAGATALTYSDGMSESRFPRGLLFSPVTHCNLNCIHCISRFTRRHVAELDDTVWAEITTAVRTGELEHLRTDYSGDIFFSDRRHGGWFDRLVALDIGLEVDTHANDLTDEVIERVMGSRLRWINFSLDSMDPDDYPRIRKGARPLEEVLAIIRKFMAVRNRSRRDMTAVLSFVLMRRNLDSLGAAIEFAAEIRASGVWCNHLHAHTSDMAEESLMLEPARYERAYRELVAAAQARGVVLRMPAPFRARAAGRGHVPCDFPWRAMAVLGNGDVMACNVPGTKIGSTRDATLAQIWNGAAMRAFRARVNTDSPPAPCSVCPMARLEHNFGSYVPGLDPSEREDFERRCLRAARHGDELRAREKLGAGS